MVVLPAVWVRAGAVAAGVTTYVAVFAALWHVSDLPAALAVGVTVAGMIIGGALLKVGITGKHALPDRMRTAAQMKAREAQNRIGEMGNGDFK